MEKAIHVQEININNSRIEIKKVPLSFVDMHLLCGENIVDSCAAFWCSLLRFKAHVPPLRRDRYLESR